MGLLDRLVTPSVDARSACEAATNGEVLLLDVREPDEFAAGRAAGSMNIPMSLLAARAGELSPEQRYITVCRSGARSRAATIRLRSRGIKTLNMKGGLKAWVLVGLPVEGEIV